MFAGFHALVLECYTQILLHNIISEENSVILLTLVKKRVLMTWNKVLIGSRNSDFKICINTTSTTNQLCKWQPKYDCFMSMHNSQLSVSLVLVDFVLFCWWCFFCCCFSPGIAPKKHNNILNVSVTKLDITSRLLSSVWQAFTSLLRNATPLWLDQITAMLSWQFCPLHQLFFLSRQK